MKWTNITWRGIAGLASILAFCGVLVFYVYLTDSPGKLHDPQNPIRSIPQLSGDKSAVRIDSFQPSIRQRAIYLCLSVTRTVLPSIHAVLASPAFWAVAAAHAGATMVKQSERILGTYFRDTSYGVVTESKASAMTAFLSLGMLAGLLVGGKAFAKAAESEQELHSFSYNSESNRHEKSSLTDAAQIGTKNMIAFLYCFAICMCYMLSFFAVPFVRRALHLPVLVLIFQVLATLGLGFGVAVQYYHIPPIVSATYGKNRGLYTAYTEGIAGLLSSIVWRIVGGAVEEGNPQVGGWAYGWAAIALLLVFCGTLMVTIVEIYFVGGGWRRDTPHENNDVTLPVELTTNINSWMDASPIRKSGRLNALSSSALDFIGSPARNPSRGTRSLLTSIDSYDEEDAVSGNRADLLGIDDDGTFLFPTNEGRQYDVTHMLNSENTYKGQYNDCPFNSFEL
jgi:MFS family permease